MARHFGFARALRRNAAQRRRGNPEPPAVGRRSLLGVRGRCGRSRGRARDRGTLHLTAARAHPPARLSHGQGERRPADRARASIFRRRSAYPRIQRRRPARAVDQGRRDPHRDRSAPHRPVDPAHRGRLAGDGRPARRRRIGADDEGGVQARAGAGNPGIGRRSCPPATAPSCGCTSSKASASKRSRRPTASTASPSRAGSGPRGRRCSTGCAGGSGRSSGSSRRSSTAWRGWRGVSFRSI